MLTRHDYIKGNTVSEIFTDILAKNPVHPSSFNPSVSKDFEEIVMKLLEKSPERRFKGADELIIALKNLPVEN